MTRTHISLIYIYIYDIAANALATTEDRLSVFLVLNYLSRNIPVLISEGLNFEEAWYHAMGCRQYWIFINVYGWIINPRNIENSMTVVSALLADGIAQVCAGTVRTTLRYYHLYGCTRYIEAKTKWSPISWRHFQTHWMKIVVFWLKFH